MTIEEKLDLVLAMYHRRQSDHPKKQEWDQLAKQICDTNSEATAFLMYRDYLIDQKLIYLLADGSGNYGTTVYGALAVENGGLKKKKMDSDFRDNQILQMKQTQTETQEQIVRLTRILAFLTGVGALYSIIQIWEFYQKSSCHCH